MKIMKSLSELASKTQPLANGVIVYQGPSLIDGGPIVAIITGLIRPSKNIKTGDVLQLWIIRSDNPPSIAHAEGLDVSVCGNCPLRGNSTQHRICYVNLGQAPNRVYYTYVKKNYVKISDYKLAHLLLSRKPVRLGAYGDPIAVPFDALDSIIKSSNRITGFTHQWNSAISLPWRGILQASCETLEEAQKAQSLGWKTFRIVKKSSEISDNEILCPAQTNKMFQCSQCGICNGHTANVAVIVHGIGKKYFNNKENKKERC